jgi:mannan endo-1,4-beta-mannosidase
LNKGSGADGSSTIYVDSIKLGNGTTPPPPTPVNIDNYEGYGGSNGNLQAAYVPNSSGNAITASLDSANKSQGTYGLKLAYTMGTPDYTGVIHTISQNWTSKTGIQFWLKPDGSNRTLTIQFKESNGELWEKAYTLSSTTSGTITLPFTTFAHPSWYTGGNGTRDLGAIAEFNIYVNQGSGGAGSSTIYLDDIQAY